jgi:hypothetical protein
LRGNRGTNTTGRPARCTRSRQTRRAFAR